MRPAYGPAYGGRLLSDDPDKPPPKDLNPLEFRDAPVAPKVPNPLLKKVRKVSGELSELATTGTGGAPGSKATDFRWAMDRDLDSLAEMVEGPWAEIAERPQAVATMKDVVWNLKRRADRSGYVLLSEVCLLFMDYMTQVSYANQDRKVIENYFDAVRVISKKNIIGRGAELGEAMLAELARINRQAGVKTT